MLLQRITSYSDVYNDKNKCGLTNNIDICYTNIIYTAFQGNDFRADMAPQLAAFNKSKNRMYKANIKMAWNAFQYCIYINKTTS